MNDIITTAEPDTTHFLAIEEGIDELRIKLVCTATKGADCHKRHPDPTVESYSLDDPDLIDTDTCWAVEWVEEGGAETLMAVEDAAFPMVPVRLSYEEGPLVEPIAPHPLLPTEPARVLPSREDVRALFHQDHMDPCTGWCETQAERVLDLLANAPTVEQIRAQLIAEISADFDQLAIRWKRGGYGSNPVDEQTIAFAADALHWLRALAPTQPTPVFEAMGLPSVEVPSVGGEQR